MSHFKHFGLAKQRLPGTYAKESLPYEEGLENVKPLTGIHYQQSNFFAQ